MTWQEYIEECAYRLAACRKQADVDRVIAEIEREIAGTPPPSSMGANGFWHAVVDAFQLLPQGIIKEATAAASLNALLATSDALMAARLQTKTK